MSFWSKFTANRSLRPSARSSTLVSMAESLAVIANALKVIVIREYSIDLDAPQPSRADREREIMEPIYSDNTQEAIREEIARLEAIERDMAREQRDVRVSARPLRAMQAAQSDHRAGEDDDMSPEERAALREIESGDR